MALIAGLTAWTQSRDNQRRRTEGAARRIAAVADALRTTDPRTAQLLGVAAWRVSELPETRRALLGSLGQQELDTFSDPALGDGPVRILTDSGRALLSVEGRTWRTWDVARHRRMHDHTVVDGRLRRLGDHAQLVEVRRVDTADTVLCLRRRDDSPDGGVLEGEHHVLATPHAIVKVALQRD
ncbi:hypothetical protein [Streptomyces sp. NPDC000877]|uniref:hypothetical protein n=1 Tax=unclassified Streptomyces TaxID=2593676 RepID=UPI0033261458